VDAGYLTPEQARSHPYSNVITRCVGANSDVMPDVYLGTVKPGDLFLLASDGLTGMLEDPSWRSSWRETGCRKEQVDDLITERTGTAGSITSRRSSSGSIRWKRPWPTARRSRKPGARPR